MTCSSRLSTSPVLPMPRLIRGANPRDATSGTEAPSWSADPPDAPLTLGRSPSCDRSTLKRLPRNAIARRRGLSSKTAV